MTTFPGSPKLLKGAIAGIDPFNPLASVIIFQYNSEQLSRQLEARTADGEGGDAVVVVPPTGSRIGPGGAYLGNLR